MIDRIKLLVKKYFTHFSYFYSQLGYRVLIALALSIVVGVLDGFGLAMFIPLLQMVDGSQNVDSENLGGMDFLVEGIENMGIELNLQSVLIIILVFFVFKGIVKFCQSYYNVITLQTFTRNLRVKFARKLGNYKFENFTKLDSGMIQNTMSGEVGRVAMAFKAYFAAVQSGILVLVYMIMALVTDFQFAILVAFGGVLSNFAYKSIYKKTKSTSKKITQGGHVYQSLLIQKVAFFKYLKATGFMKDFFKQVKSSIEYIENSNRKIGFYNSLVLAAREPMVIFVVILVILIQVSLFSEGLGAIVLSLLLFYRSLNALVEVQNQWNNFLNVSGSLANTIQFEKGLDSNQEIEGDIPYSGFQKSIKFDRVSLSYGDKKVLNDISFSIPSKSTVALIGESGSGKSTLVNIIASLIPPSSGEVTLDGTSLKNLTKTSYHKKIGYITQEPVIFSDTVFNNVTLWSEKTEENLNRFWKALKQASIFEFVDQLSLKEDTNLGNTGILISGGQKQRLSIARELFKDIDILLMDEATSALDSETERIIKENIDSLKGKYTIIIIAHRLSTIKEADQIILLSEGEILEMGDFKSLVERSPIVRKMVELQEV